MEFQVDPASRTPIYRQLVAQVRAAAARGRLVPDQRLPSVRELSRQLVINPNTVARAYTELEREGVLNTRPGLGVFVARPRSNLTKRARKQRLRALVDELLIEAVHLNFTADETRDLLSERMAKFQWVSASGSE